MPCVVDARVTARTSGQWPGDPSTALPGAVDHAVGARPWSSVIQRLERPTSSQTAGVTRCAQLIEQQSAWFAFQAGDAWVFDQARRWRGTKRCRNAGARMGVLTVPSYIAMSTLAGALVAWHVYSIHQQ